MNKKLCMFLMGCFLAVPVFLQADALGDAVEREVKRQSLPKEGLNIMDQARKCRKNLKKEYFGMAAEACAKALDMREAFLEHAKQENIKVVDYMMWGLDNKNELPDPLHNFQDTKENLLFALVMVKDGIAKRRKLHKLSLKELLEQNRDLRSNRGLVAALLKEHEGRGRQTLSSDYVSVNEAFRDWKGCAASIQEAGLNIDPAGFCHMEKAGK